MKSTDNLNNTSIELTGEDDRFNVFLRKSVLNQILLISALIPSIILLYWQVVIFIGILASFHISDLPYLIINSLGIFGVIGFFKLFRSEWTIITTKWSSIYLVLGTVSFIGFVEKISLIGFYKWITGFNDPTEYILITLPIGLSLYFIVIGFLRLLSLNKKVKIDPTK